MTAAFKALGFAASARILLLMAILCAFALAWRAIDTQSYVSVGVLISWCALIILPIVGLEIRKSRG